MSQSTMRFQVLREGAMQGFVRGRRMIEQVEKAIAITIRERDHALLVETDLVFRNHSSLSDTYFRLAHLLDNDGRVRERLRQANSPLRISRPGFHRDVHGFALIVTRLSVVQNGKM